MAWLEGNSRPGDGPCDLTHKTEVQMWISQNSGLEYKVNTEILEENDSTKSTSKLRGIAVAHVWIFMKCSRGIVTFSFDNYSHLNEENLLIKNLKNRSTFVSYKPVSLRRACLCFGSGRLRDLLLHFMHRRWDYDCGLGLSSWQQLLQQQ